MTWDWLDGLFDFFSDMKSWIAFFTDILNMLPSIFTTCISILLIAVIVFGGLYILLKLVG